MSELLSLTLLIALTVSVVVPAVMLTWLSIELVFGLKRTKAPGVRRNDDLRIAILIPAHDEELSIASTVTAAQAAAPGARILVVADNCSDATAQLAREAGAEVTERNDPDNRGKGFALQRGQQVLAQDPPQVVIVLDADCRLAPDAAGILGASVMRSGRPAQALNLLDPVVGQSPIVGISNFAMMVKNLVRARGLQRIGGGAFLFGTGMAFPWPVFAELPLGTSEAVEDLAMSLHLARGSVAIQLVDTARVSSPPASVSDSRGQRSRWEHGFLRVASRLALPMILQGSIRGSRLRTAIGLHLSVPPLALVMLISLIGLAVAAAAAIFVGVYLPLLILAVPFVTSSILLLVVWWREGRELLTLRELAFAPVYIAWKIPMYANFFVRRQVGWNRTPRTADQD